MSNNLILSSMRSTPWAILPGNLKEIYQIAQTGRTEPLEAIEKRIGKPLKNTRSVSVRNGVAIVPVTGPIFRYANMFTDISGATSSQMLAREISTALDDPDIKAIILDVDSPGGQAFGVDEVSDLIFKGRQKKPIYAHIGGYGASAAYFIASAAQAVYGSPNSMTGSIGAVMVISTDSDDSELQFVSAQSPLKRPDISTEEGRGAYQRSVDDLAEVFINRVARNRGVSPETVASEFGQGDVLVGHRAAQAGLIDGVMDFEELLQQVSKGKSPAKTQIVIRNEGEERTMSTENNTQPALTLEILKNQHSGLYEQVKTIGFDEGRTAGLSEGAKIERERIQSVEAQLMPGHEKLIADLKFDGKTTGPEAAVQVLNAHKAILQQAHNTFVEEAPKPVPAAVTDEIVEESKPQTSLPSDFDKLTIEEQCKIRWEKDPEIRSEYSSLEIYTSFERNAPRTRHKTQ